MAFPLLRLPNELLYKVCECLDSDNLRQVALVNKYLRPIAQKTLHISLDLTNGDWDGRLGLLARTLSLRPDLTKVVRHFATVARDDVEFEADCSAGLSSEYCEVIDGKATARVINEQRLAGQILTHLPRLRGLILGLIREIGEDRNEDFSPFPMNGLFGDAAIRGDSIRIPGLQNLEKLELHAIQLDWPWCLLPRLKKLSLNLECKILDYHGKAGTPAIEELKLALDTTSLTSSKATYRNVSPFLSRLRVLKVLRIDLHNSHYLPLLEISSEIVSASSQGEYSNIVGMLSPVCVSLESLQFGLHQKWQNEKGDYLDWVQPVDTFTSFQRLRLLTISQEGLLGLSSNRMKQPNSILPSTLEKLRILYPRTTIYSWLEQIPHCREQLPHLQVVVLWITTKRGDPFESLRYTNSYSSINKAFRDVGIRLELQCSPNTSREEWKDENYDPCTGNLAEFFNSLGVHG